MINPMSRQLQGMTDSRNSRDLRLQIQIGILQRQLISDHLRLGSAKLPKQKNLLLPLMSTPINFSAHVTKNLKIENLTQEHLVGPAFNLLKGTCRSRVELEYHFKECYKAFLFINNDLEYLKGGSSSKKYTTSTTKTKAAKYLEEIEVRRVDQQLYKFREGDFLKLNLCDIEDMLLLLVQKKLSNLEIYVIYDLNVALRMFTRRVVILKWVEDLQLGVKSYQKKLNITKPETFKPDITNMTLYTAYNNP
ncbi:hypothetical protein Tco_1076930 [Tanacetum coccineum]